MKEKEFEKLLAQSKIDEAMDNRIEDNLLLYNPSVSSNLAKGKITKLNKMLYSRAFHFAYKAAAVVVVLAVVGGATAWAAKKLVKTYPTEIRTVTEEELINEYEELGIDYDEYQKKVAERSVRKNFGTGNSMVSPITDTEGNILEPDENGFIHFSDGSTFKPAAARDPKGHEKDRISAEEAFAELGIPNLIPDYVYDNYFVSEGGFRYVETAYDDWTAKTLTVSFFPDYKSPEYAEGDLFRKRIYFTFSPFKELPETPGVSMIGKKNPGEISSYTTINGIECTILTDTNIMAFIYYSSDTIGDGHMAVEFVGHTMDEATRILDMLSLTEDNTQNTEME
jgi:hypothetical protein